MKNKTKTITAVLLAVAVGLGSTAGCLAAKYSNEGTSKDLYAEESSVETMQETKELIEASSYEEVLSMNDEVVYVFTDATGKTQKVMDSVWIEKGNTGFIDGDNANLPLDVSVSYKLDGKKVSEAELAGKSGHLVIRADFKDLQYEMRTVNGKEEKIYVPFIASLISVLDSSNFSNVEVSTGRVSYDGARYAVVGLAIPGLKEDLNSDKADEKIPEYIEIEADVKDCSISGMYLLVSNSIFNELDVDSSDKMEELHENVDKIADAMNSLMDGSNAIYDGLGELYDGAKKYSDGIDRLTNGLGQIDGNSEALVNGAKQVFETLLATASTQMRQSGISVGNLSIDNYATVLTNVISEQYPQRLAASTVEAAVRGNIDTIRAQVTLAVKENVRQQATQGYKEQVASAVRPVVAAAIADSVNAAYGTSITAEYVLSDPAYAETLEEQSAPIIDAKMEEEATVTAINGIVEAKMETEEVTNIINQKTEETVQNLISQNMTNAEVVNSINEGTKKIVDLKASLDSYNTFYQGIIAYTGGVDSAYKGALELQKNMPALLDGINTLKEGSGKLSDGLEKFNEEGVSKITELVNDTLEGLIDRFDVIADVSKNYKTYDSAGDLNKESVKFIYKIEAIK